MGTGASMRLRLAPMTLFSAQLDVAEAEDWNFYTAIMSAQASTLTLTLSLTSAANGSTPQINLFAAIGTDFALSNAAPGFQYALPTITATGVEVSVTLNRADAAFATGCPPIPGTPAQYANVSGNWTLIAPATAPSPAACTIQVLVVSATTATFIVTATTVSRELLNGVATSGTAPPGAALYYTFDAGASATTIQVSLDSLAGSAIAYISPSVPTPNVSTAAYTIGGLYGGSVTLNPSTDGCVSSEGSTVAAASSSCYYFITVMSASPGASAVFRLQATASLVVRLTPGQATSGVAGPSSFVYYSVDVPRGFNGGLSLIAQVRRPGPAAPPLSLHHTRIPPRRPSPAASSRCT